MLKEKKREKAEVRPAASLYLLKNKMTLLRYFSCQKTVKAGGLRIFVAAACLYTRLV